MAILRIKDADGNVTEVLALRGEPGKSGVLTVNGIAPDENGNVNVDGGGGGSVQFDWNQNDETAVDFIKNRPFYEETGTTKVVLFDGDVELLVMMPEGTPEGWWYESLTFENGKIYTVAIEDEQQDIVCENNELIFISSTLSDTYSLSADGIFSRDGTGPEGTYHIKIETTEVSTTVKQLDEKYVPDTIARAEDIPTDDHINALIDAKQNAETDPTVPAWAKAETKPTYTAAEVGALPLPDSAEVGQFFKVSAVENGKVTAVEAVDAPSGGGGGLKLAARVTTTENSAAIAVTGLAMKLPISIRLYNSGVNAGNGVCISINGSRQNSYTGTQGGSSPDAAKVRCWIYEDTGKMVSSIVLENSEHWVAKKAYHTWNFIPSVIESVELTSGYHTDGGEKYYQAGTILEIYEGVYPNVE